MVRRQCSLFRERDRVEEVQQRRRFQRCPPFDRVEITFNCVCIVEGKNVSTKGTQMHELAEEGGHARLRRAVNGR